MIMNIAQKISIVFEIEKKLCQIEDIIIIMIKEYIKQIDIKRIPLFPITLLRHGIFISSLNICLRAVWITSPGALDK